jgi:ssDNA-binding Zn-finger/Zn-ribbon topoisomerase 1
MKKTLVIVGVIFLLVIVGSASWFLSRANKAQNQIVAENPTVSQNNSNLRYANIAYSEKITLSKGKGVTKEAASCIECHSQKTPAIVQDWSKSSMAHAGVSCIDCHGVSKDNPMANQNCPGVKVQIYMLAQWYRLKPAQNATQTKLKNLKKAVMQGLPFR